MNYESKFRSSADQNPVVIDPSKIPKVELNLLCASLLSAVQAFYENPENVRRFEEWRAARMKKGEHEHGTDPECEHRSPESL